MTILAPGFTERRTAAVGSWQPSRFTRPLCGCPELGCECIVTDGGRLIAFAIRFVVTAMFGKLELDDWQRALIRAVLERYPDDWHDPGLAGQLRYRQVVISMGRQNGKSLLGMLFVLYFLCLHVRGPNVIGLASIDRQAKIVYKRVKFAIDQSPDMSRELKTTETRGINRRDGSGAYFTLPAKEDSAQGEPGTGIVYDELHLGLAALWDAMVLAQRAIRNSLMVGITTAGDDGSELLIRLYAEGDAAIAGEDERFGFFLWEAADDELTEANVIAANPAIACGRVDLAVAMSDARKMEKDPRRDPATGLTGKQRMRRYTLNRFVAGAAGAWVPLESWDAKTGQPEIVGNCVYSIERTESWEWATVHATAKVDGVFQTELVASIEAPELDQLEAVCSVLASRTPGAVFAMDSKTLGDLALRLRDQGREVWRLGATEMVAAAQHAYAVIHGPGRLVHAGDQLVRRHVARGRRRDSEGGWRLSRSLSLGDADAAFGLVVGLYVADRITDDGLPLY